MAQIGKYTVMLVVAFFLSLFAEWTKSDFLTDFFAKNAILLGVTIFTINAAAVGILMSQLEILRRNTGSSFTNTIREIRKSFREAFAWLLGVMCCAIIMAHSKEDLALILKGLHATIWLPAILLFFIIALLFIVYDTANAILICLEQPPHDGGQ